MSDQDLFYQFIACDYRMQSPSLFQNIFQFCILFAQIFKYSALFQHFFALTFLCPFSEKIAPMPLLSRIPSGDIWNKMRCIM